MDFLAGENRYAALKKKDPATAEKLNSELRDLYAERTAIYTQIADLPYALSDDNETK